MREALLPSGCSLTQQCPCASPWENHGGFVGCVSRERLRFCVRRVTLHQETYAESPFTSPPPLHRADQLRLLSADEP